MSALLEIQGLTKRFAKDETGVVALRDIDLEVEKGSFVTILGRGGCGKSTALNLLSGLLARRAPGRAPGARRARSPVQDWWPSGQSV